MRAAATSDQEQLTVGADELRFRVTSADSDGDIAALAAAHGVEITRQLEAIR